MTELDEGSMCVDDADDLDFKSGQFITTRNNKYVVIDEIGRGGFGSVYKVRREPNTGVEYAMKVELKDENRQHSKLSMEVHLLKLMSTEPSNRKKHFLQIFDRAKKESFFLLVMTLVGENIKELKKQRSPPVFTIGTGFGVGIQCLEGIEELHKVGFIHRDIKPANFAIGRYPLTHFIYILDFGIARKFFKENSTEVKSPRESVSFKGTVRFASLSSHRGEDLGRRDDCESWMYLLVDLCNKQGLPWVLEKEKKPVEDMKKEARTASGKQRLFDGMCLACMTAIMNYIDSLQYSNEVDYSFIYQQVRRAALNLKVSLKGPFDWEKSVSNKVDRTISSMRTTTTQSKNK